MPRPAMPAKKAALPVAHQNQSNARATSQHRPYRQKISQIMKNYTHPRHRKISQNTTPSPPIANRQPCKKTNAPCHQPLRTSDDIASQHQHSRQNESPATTKTQQPVNLMPRPSLRTHPSPISHQKQDVHNKQASLSSRPCHHATTTNPLTPQHATRKTPIKNLSDNKRQRQHRPPMKATLSDSEKHAGTQNSLFLPNKHTHHPRQQRRRRHPPLRQPLPLPHKPMMTIFTTMKTSIKHPPRNLNIDKKADPQVTQIPHVHDAIT